MWEDKTQVFHDQIEVKQKELQPWTTKINAKQAEIDVATSERDTLSKKVEAVQNARGEAQEALEKLKDDYSAKVLLSDLNQACPYSDCQRNAKDRSWMSRGRSYRKPSRAARRNNR